MNPENLNGYVPKEKQEVNIQSEDVQIEDKVLPESSREDLEEQEYKPEFKLHGVLRRKTHDGSGNESDRIIVLCNTIELYELEKSPIKRYVPLKALNAKEIALAKEAKDKFNLGVEIPAPQYGPELLSDDDWNKLLKDYNRAWENAEVKMEECGEPYVQLDLKDIEDGTYYSRMSHCEERFKSINISNIEDCEISLSGGSRLDAESKKELQEMGFSDKAIDAAEKDYQEWHDYMQKNVWGSRKQEEEKQQEERKQFLIKHFGLENKMNK